MFNSIRLNGLYYGPLQLQTGGYINFGIPGSLGYGFRDNAGSIEYKDSGGSWNAVSNLTTNDWARSGGLLSPLVASDIVALQAAVVYSKIAQFGTYDGDGPANILNPASGDIALAFYPQIGFTGDSVSDFYGNQFDTTISGTGNLSGTGYCLTSGLFFSGSGILSTAVIQDISIGNEGAGSITNARGIRIVQMDGASNIGFQVANLVGPTENISFLSAQNSGTGNYAFRGTGTAPSKLGGTMSATGYLVDAVAGIDATITTATLVGKTITVTKGIITGFA